MSKLDNIDPTKLSSNPRATLSAWEKYRGLVEAAYSISPRVHAFKPNNLSPATVASRVRDAIRGAIAFDYPCCMGREGLLRWYADVIVKHDLEYVYIGPETPVSEELRGDTPVSDSSILSFVSLTFEEVVAFTILLASGRIKGPVIINHPPDLSLLPPRDNVEIMVKPDGKVILY